MEQPLVVFDLDETLIAGDSGMLWHRYLVQQGIVTDPNFIAEDERLMGLYSEGKLDLAEYLRFSLAPLADVTTERVEGWVEGFVDECISPIVFSEAKQLLAQLTAKGQQVLIISATVSFIVKPIAQLLGVSAALGVDLELQGSSYSATIKGVPTYKEGKVQRLQGWLAEQERRFSEIHCYSDSINDSPLLQFADQAFTVNPCAQLAVQAQKNGWPVLRWRVAD